MNIYSERCPHCRQDLDVASFNPWDLAIYPPKLLQIDYLWSAKQVQVCGLVPIWTRNVVTSREHSEWYMTFMHENNDFVWVEVINFRPKNNV